MPLEKLLEFTQKVSDLADKPNATMSAAEVKAVFDAAPDEVRVYLNQLIDKLQSVVDGDSGADNIGVTGISGLTGDSVQELLESLKIQIDTTVLGQIPDGSLTDVKLSNAEGNIKQAFASHQADYVKHPAFATATGTANAYSITLNPTPTAYEDGMGIVVVINADSTGATTLNVNGIGVKPIKKANGNDVTNLNANGVYTLRYNSAANAGTGAFILQGESEVEIGQQIITPSTINQAISKGVHDGTGYVVGSSNLIASNIKNGVNIFGVVGSLPSYSSVAKLGDNKISSATTDRTVTNSTNTKVKEIEVTNLTGQVVVRWNIRSTSGAGIEGRLYHNSTEIDYALVSSSTYTVREKTISISPGDRISVWLQYNGANCNELSLIGIFQPPAQSILMS